MISDNLKKAYEDIHKSTPFGKRSKIPKDLKKFIEKLTPRSICDFGCGKGNLIETLKENFPNIEVTGYDPANEKFSRPLDDRFFDLLISTDVLEHVEPEFINETLKFLSDKSRYIYHKIALSPAKLILPDGRNAHLIQESPDWWRKKFLDLRYKILNEEYKEFEKFPKQHKWPDGSSRPMLVKNYIIFAEIEHVKS
jgi:2-polyprenyl-3-methyl-5-hydroxy-6-metoxy-1,4-benzoquinol methylase